MKIASIGHYTNALYSRDPDDESCTYEHEINFCVEHMDEYRNYSCTLPLMGDVHSLYPKYCELAEEIWEDFDLPDEAYEDLEQMLYEDLDYYIRYKISDSESDYEPEKEMELCRDY